MLNNARIDRLGERLRRGQVDDASRSDYENYRASFEPDLLRVITMLARTSTFGYPAVARLKTLESVVAKLQRQSARLSQLQDIAGCRIVVGGIEEQDNAIARLRTEAECRVVDYRDSDQCGYRAVHCIDRTNSARLVEIQVRTVVQDAWANLSESLSERHGIEVKYCGGPIEVRTLLGELAGTGRRIEEQQAQVSELKARAEHLDANRDGDGSSDQRVLDLLNDLDQMSLQIDRRAREFVTMTSELSSP